MQEIERQGASGERRDTANKRSAAPTSQPSITLCPNWPVARKDNFQNCPIGPMAVDAEDDQIDREKDWLGELCPFLLH